MRTWRRNGQRGVSLGMCPGCGESVWSNYPVTLVYVVGTPDGTSAMWAHPSCAKVDA